MAAGGGAFIWLDTGEQDAAPLGCDLYLAIVVGSRPSFTEAAWILIGRAQIVGEGVLRKYERYWSCTVEWYNTKKAYWILFDFIMLNSEDS